MEEGKKNQNEGGTPRQGGVWWEPAVKILSDVSTWIVVPIVFALIFGKILDARYGTKPVIFLCLAFVGFLISAFGIVKVVRRYVRDMKKEDLSLKVDKTQ